MKVAEIWRFERGGLGGGFYSQTKAPANYCLIPCSRQGGVCVIRHLPGWQNSPIGAHVRRTKKLLYMSQAIRSE